MTSFNKKQVIVVTGANGIIGSSVCKMALSYGLNVAAFDLEINQLNLLKEQYHQQILIHCCDLRVKSEIQAGLEKIIDSWKQIDGLFNNAAWKGSNIKNFFQSFEDYSLATWREIMSVNVDGVMLVDQVIGSYMANVQARGSIVHTSSIYGLVAPDQRIYDQASYLGVNINTPAVYSTSKGAIIALTKYLATYWASKGVRVNCVSPGGVESGQNKAFQENYSNKVPLSRMAKAEEVAEAVLFLLSSKSSYITGHNLIVDGGFSAW